MSAVAWKPELVIEQDADAILDYALGFDAWLKGENISSVVLTAESCLAEQRSITSTGLVLRVRAVERNASVRVHLVTNSGQEDDFTIYFTPIEK